MIATKKSTTEINEIVVVGEDISDAITRAVKPLANEVLDYHEEESSFGFTRHRREYYFTSAEVTLDVSSMVWRDDDSLMPCWGRVQVNMPVPGDDPHEFSGAICFSLQSFRRDASGRSIATYTVESED